jgi:hypothetical protein
MYSHARMREARWTPERGMLAAAVNAVPGAAAVMHGAAVEGTLGIIVPFIAELIARSPDENDPLAYAALSRVDPAF